MYNYVNAYGVRVSCPKPEGTCWQPKHVTAQQLKTLTSKKPSETITQLESVEQEFPVTNFDDWGDRQFMMGQYSHMREVFEDDINKDLEFVQSFFTQGRCHVYAMALQTLQPNLTLHVSVGWDEENESDDNYFVDHIYCVDYITGKAYDSTGEYASEQALLESNPDFYVIERENYSTTVKDVEEEMARGELLPVGEYSMKLAYKLAALNMQSYIYNA